MPRKVALSSDDAALDECEELLGHRFNDRDLLLQTLTHASIAHTRLYSNERLEFLGDAIMGAIVCEMLFERYPEATEGELTRIKSVVVSRATCARVTRRIGLNDFILLGKGVRNNQRIPSSIVAAVYESVIAGLYLDGGFDVARRFIEESLSDEILNAADSTSGINHKSLLQQLAQRRFGETPLYQVLDEKGPDHSKCFKVCAAIDIETFPAAWGPNKKEAEQRAAHNALCVLDGKPVPHEAE